MSLDVNRISRDNVGITSSIVISFVSPTCSVKSESVNSFSSKVSSPSVIRSLFSLCLKFNFPFFTFPDPVKLPPTISPLSISTPLNDQYNLVLLGTSVVLNWFLKYRLLQWMI